MSSSSKARALRLSSEIRRSGILSPISCDRCLLAGLDCYIMPSNDPNARLRCSECVRLGRPCVNLSWSSLDKTREEYAKKVEEDEALLATVVARLMRNKKILKQAEERAKKKALCLMSEMDASGELDADPSENCPAADATVGFSPLMWSTMSMVNDFVGVVDVPAGETSG
jgi:hypothetical protein